MIEDELKIIKMFAFFINLEILKIKNKWFVKEFINFAMHVS